jgi:hypothetical protein
MDTRGHNHHNEHSTTTAWEVVVDELELKPQTKTDFKMVTWKDYKPEQFSKTLIPQLGGGKSKANWTCKEKNMKPTKDKNSYLQQTTWKCLKPPPP